ncbi:hypothetical protein CDQ84_13230 [Clostridium thermosuccinogenes]|uniref:YesK-like protein n=1 Tax=Clostridium thermosuccinogenes TaxID=84032 RepID=A0A2K2FF50_9CLOT|nr:hypothetical protein [Pseudoclostridium thermosuccinogenes]AUS98539.1 hypothetical protein CDO33_20035 [Pseudoclostridium thermosuccinogenes]PNT95983.1 hypothetical protein CDQ85_13100 [Pseudoclostridium thermosuccinogenes]PNT97410.1 hypothetical protein CDQ84_13230 [Pseudoclostridium thermosuccinogenes]
MNLQMIETRFILLLAGTAAIFAVITLLLHIFFRKRRYIKYIPCVFTLAFGIYNFVLAFTVETVGFNDIGKAILGIISMVGFTASLVSAVLFDIFAFKK